MKIIKDPVHGYILLDKDELDDIVDTRYFQRLRSIMQMSTTQMVYPSARHSRFEHSLGVFHLCKSIFKNIREQNEKDERQFTKDIDDPGELDKIEKTLRYASLLHDIGHFPFSHLSEKFVDKNQIIDKLENEHQFLTEIANADKKYSGIKNKLELAKTDYLKNSDGHELMSCLLILSKFKGKITERLLDPYEICAFVLGFSFEGLKKSIWQYNVAAHILNSRIDADKLDYILRDNKMTGASLSAIDSERMIMAYTTCEKKLALSSKALSVIKNFVSAREAEYLWICQHHKVLFSNALVERMIDKLPPSIKNKLFTYDAIANQFVDDCCVMHEIRTHSKRNKILKEYYRQYTERDFLKSCWKHFLDFNQIFDKDVRVQLRQYIKAVPEFVEEDLKRKLNIKKEEIVINFIDHKKFTIADYKNILIDCNGEAKSLFELRLYDEEKIEKSLPYVYLPASKVTQGIKELEKFAKATIVSKKSSA